MAVAKKVRREQDGGHATASHLWVTHERLMRLDFIVAGAQSRARPRSIIF